MSLTTAHLAGRAVELLRRESDGPPLVLLHGAGANAHVWSPVADELGAFDVIAPSLPGRGASEGEAFDDPAAAAAWLADVLAALGGPPPFVLGHSWGGAIAMELALRGVELAGLVLVATGARLRVHPSVIEAASEAIAAGAPMGVRFAFVNAPAAAIDAYEAAVATTPPIATAADWAGCDAFDRLGQLDAIEAPALVVGGTADALTPPKYHAYLEEQLPRAQRVMLEGCGHMLPWEEPRRLAREVRTFAAAC